MKIIKILPHHVSAYFEAYFLKRKIGENHSWYDDEKFKQHGEATIQAVVSNPAQLVQIVSSYDIFCEMCPRNKKGQNCVQPENICTQYEDTNFVNELETAKMLGIDDLIDQKSIPAEALFDKLKPVYGRIFTEEPNQNSSKLTPREYFRVSAVDLILLNNFKTQ